MTVTEIANQLIALCREQRFVEAVDTLYADNVVSVEAMAFGGMSREMQGKEAVRGKNVWWLENNVVHSITVTGPFASEDKFAVLFVFDRTDNTRGVRDVFHEVAVYTVHEGKIVREEFLYAV